MPYINDDPAVVPVLFRRWLDGFNDVFAVFPTLPADINGNYVTTFSHIGQHGMAFYPVVLMKSRPATREEEYQELKRELEGIGYRMRVVRRVTRQMHDERIGRAKKS